jgi:hypothetical protein
MGELSETAAQVHAAAPDGTSDMHLPVIGLADRW